MIKFVLLPSELYSEEQTVPVDAVNWVWWRTLGSAGDLCYSLEPHLQSYFRVINLQTWISSGNSKYPEEALYTSLADGLGSPNILVFLSIKRRIWVVFSLGFKTDFYLRKMTNNAMSQVYLHAWSIFHEERTKTWRWARTFLVPGVGATF